MPLTIVSNFAADVAQRQLAQSNDAASGSIAKLSSGTRVLAARDDAAALAIGSRLRADVAAIQQASVNAGQAISLLQIADGALSQINDTLIRLQSLSVQAGSDQLGSTERGLIDTEFQQLLSEVQRIAEDTEFNGQSLISGGALSTLVNASDPGSNGVSGISFDSSVTSEEVFQYSYNTTGEILSVTKLAVDGATVNTPTSLATGNFTENNLSVSFDDTVSADAVYTYSYAQATQQLTLNNINTGETATIDITDAFNAAFGSGTNTIATGQSLAVDFQDLGVTITLGENFDRTAALPETNIVSQALTNAGDGDLDGGGVTGVTIASTGVTRTAIDVLTGLNDANATYNAAAGTLTLTLNAGTNDVVSLNGGNSITVAGVGDFEFNGNANATADGSALNFTLDFNGVSLFTVSHNLDIDGANGDDAITLTLTVDDLFHNAQSNTSGSNETVQVDLTSDLDAVAGTGNNLAFGQTVDIGVEQFGVTLTLDNGFDRTSNVATTTGTVTDTTLNFSGGTFTPNAGFLNADAYNALLALGRDATSGIGYDATTGILSVQVRETGDDVTLDGVTGLRYDNGVAGEASGDLVTPDQVGIGIVVADGSTVNLGTLAGAFVNGQPNGATGLINIQLGAGVFYNSVNENASTNDFTFKVGTGNESFDRITISVNSVTLEALGINGTDVTTSANADAASTAIAASINTLNSARANIGAFQNRLDIAAANLATTEENTEAARSALLDLNVASEISEFTSRQILVQAGVSALAQANQLPQNLLRLLQ